MTATGTHGTAGDEQERRAIMEAMQRLLDGQTNRKLTVKDLAEEAGLKRHTLTHKHTDLKDLFYRRIAESGVHKEPAYVLRLREEIAKQKERLQERAAKIESQESQIQRYAENLAVAVARVRQLENDLDSRAARIAEMDARVAPSQTSGAVLRSMSRARRSRPFAESAEEDDPAGSA